MASKKILYLDIETTGLNPLNGAVILSIGAVVDRKTKRNPIAEFYGLIKPTFSEWEIASPKALEVNGLTYEYLQEHGKPFSDVRDMFISFLVEMGITGNKAIVVGQNPNFDMSFLRQYMLAELAFIGFPFHEVYDNRDFYSILENRRVVPLLKGRSGANIAAALGVEPEPEPHNALEGARVAKRNFEAMLALGVREE